MKNISVIFFFLMTLGCVSTSVSKNSLAPIEDITPSIILKEPYKFDAKPAGGSLFLTLVAAEYIPVGKDQDGIFFVGPDKCLEFSGTNARQGFAMNCGIFVSFENPAVWKAFEFVGDNSAYYDNPGAYTAAATYGAATGAAAAGANSLIQSYTKTRFYVRNIVLNPNKMGYERGEGNG